MRVAIHIDGYILIIDEPPAAIKRLLYDTINNSETLTPDTIIPQLCFEAKGRVLLVRDDEMCPVRLVLTIDHNHGPMIRQDKLNSLTRLYVTAWSGKLVDL